MEALREILLNCPVTEELKWGKPCYTYDGHNLVILAPFKEYCALIFAKGALLQDRKGMLIQPTENSQASRQFRFTGLQEIKKNAKAVQAFVAQAIEVEEAGLDVEYKQTSDYKVSEELQRKLAEDSVFKKAFEALTPGRQRGYLLHFAAAKQSKTRVARIEKCTPEILKGRGLNDR